jgi:putative SOS response-associated peptidase YedK
MPAITEKSDFESWLNPQNRDTNKLRGLLKPYPVEELELYDVTPKVNSPKNNSQENIKPLK